MGKKMILAYNSACQICTSDLTNFSLINEWKGKLKRLLNKERSTDNTDPEKLSDSTIRSVKNSKIYLGMNAVILLLIPKELFKLLWVIVL